MVTTVMHLVVWRCLAQSEFDLRINDMEGAELPVGAATPGAASPDTNQICTDSVNELGAEGALAKEEKAGKEGDEVAEEEKQSLVDRVVFLRNRTAELLVCRADKPLRLVMNKLKSLCLTPALVVESGVIHLFDDMEPWSVAKLGAEAEVLQSKWMAFSQKFCHFGTSKP